MLDDQYLQLLGLELVGEICSSFRVVEHDRVETDKGIFISRAPPTAGTSQEGAEHLVWCL